MSGAAYRIMAERCDQCLVGKNRIVSKARADQLIRDARRADVKFVCHKAQIAGMEDVACRGVFGVNGPCQLHRIAGRIGIPIVEIDPASLAKAEGR